MGVDLDIVFGHRLTGDARATLPARMDDDGALVRASVSVIATSHELGRSWGLSLRDAFTSSMSSPSWLVRRPKIDPGEFVWGSFSVRVYAHAINLSLHDKYGAVLHHRSLRDVTQRAARKLARFVDGRTAPCGGAAGVDGGACIWYPDNLYEACAIGQWARTGLTIPEILAKAERELRPAAPSLDACIDQDWFVDRF
jgi:hypothetical protein